MAPMSCHANAIAFMLAIDKKSGTCLIHWNESLAAPARGFLAASCPLSYVQDSVAGPPTYSWVMGMHWSLVSGTSAPRVGQCTT